MRSQVIEEGGVLRITIPHGPAHPLLVALTLAPILLPLVASAPLARFFRETDTPAVVGGIFLGFLVVFFGVVPALTAVNGYLRGRYGATLVTVSPDALRIANRGAWRTSAVASIPATDLFDIDYSTAFSLNQSARRAADEAVTGMSKAPADAIGPRTKRLAAAIASFAKGRGITVKWRRGFTSFANGLPDDEIAYLHCTGAPP
jgi:hypothetical protein